MPYLNLERLSAIDASAFQSQKPYPWANPEGLLTERGYWRLLETLPDTSLFSSSFGKERKYGQQSHDRFFLEYREDLDIAPPWKEFITELLGKEYRAFLCRLLGVSSLRLRFHWHYTPNGCSVSPHCDNKRELGSHIFYFNSAQEWQPAWGGETLILDDGGRLDNMSAPVFDDFASITTAEALDNRSLLFARTDHSWHGVRELQCPADFLRKVFIVVIYRNKPVDHLYRFFGRPLKGY